MTETYENHQKLEIRETVLKFELGLWIIKGVSAIFEWRQDITDDTILWQTSLIIHVVYFVKSYLHILKNPREIIH